MKHRYLEAGKIVNTHGIAGEVKIMPWADDPDFLLNFKTLYLDGKPIHIRSARVHKNAVLMKLDGVDDINEAMRLKNKVVSTEKMLRWKKVRFFWQTSMVWKSGMRTVERCLEPSLMC